MNTKKVTVTYRCMNILLIIVGVISIALLFLPDFELLSFILALAVLGGLIGGENNYVERDRQHLQQSFMPAFGWLLLVLLAAFAFIACSKWFGVGEGATSFMNNHWPSLIVSVMCLILGIAGLRKTKGEGSS